MNGSAKTPEDYLKEPYARVLLPDEETGTYAAEILEFPGCVAQGDTPEEAYKNLEEAAKGWIQAALDLDQDIPEPAMNQGYGGRIALRLPRSLHRRAAQMAEQDSTSLNQFLVSAVAEKVGAESLYKHMMQELRGQLAQGATQQITNIIVGRATLPTTVLDVMPDIQMKPSAWANTAEMSSFSKEFGVAHPSPNIAIASVTGGLYAGIPGYESVGN